MISYDDVRTVMHAASAYFDSQPLTDADPPEDQEVDGVYDFILKNTERSVKLTEEEWAYIYAVLNQSDVGQMDTEEHSLRAGIMNSINPDRHGG